MKNILIVSALLLTSAVYAENNSAFQGDFECIGKEIEKAGEFKMNMTIQKTGETYTVNTRSLTDDYKGIGVGIYTHSNKSLAVG